jgi:sulfatase modifying factor 1
LPQPGDADADKPTTYFRANTWQGVWPHDNTGADGFAFTAPVNAFGAQNAHGLYNLVGNVWEWTATTWCPNVDAVSGAAIEMPDYRVPPPGAEQTARRPPPECLRIAVDLAARHKSTAEPSAVEFVKKGGSFTSRRHGDFRHRCAARDRSSAHTSGQNVGFRCVYDAPPRIGFATAAE